MKKLLFQRLDFIIALSLVVISIIFIGLIYFDWISIGFKVGPYYFSHLSAIIGTLYLLIISPFFSVLKRIKPASLKKLFRIHVFGSLLAFLLVAFHFAGQVSRPLEFYPDLGTGVGLYVAMSVLVFSGFFLRFVLVTSRSRKVLRIFHVLTVLSFYIVIIVHSLHGFGYI